MTSGRLLTQLLLWALVLLAPAAPAEAQRRSDRPLIRMELEYLYLTGSVSPFVADEWLAGGEAGFGLGQSIQTGDRNFVRYSHVGGFFTLLFRENVWWDLALHGGLGDFRPPSCSGIQGCWGDNPRWYAGIVTSLSYGGERWYIGTRLSGLRLGGVRVLGWTPAFIGVRF